MSELLHDARSRTILLGGGRVAIGQGVGRALDVLLLVVFGRVLGPAGVGTYLWGFALLTVLRTISALGVDYANVKFFAVAHGTPYFASTLALLQKNERKCLLLSALLTAAVLTIILVLPSLLGDSIPPTHITSVAVMALALPAATGQLLASSALRGMGRVGTDALLYNTGRPATHLVAFATLFALDIPAMLAVGIAFSLGYIVCLFAQTFYITRLQRQANVDSRSLREVVEAQGPTREEINTYANQMWVVGALSVLATRGDRLVVTGVLDSVALGLLLTALTVGEQVTFFLEALKSAFAPRIAAIHSRGEVARLDRELKVTTGWILYITLPVIIAISVAAPEILSIIGENFVSAWPLLLVILSGQVIRVVSGTTNAVLYMTGHQKVEILNLGVTVVLGFASLRLAVTYSNLLAAAGCAAMMVAGINTARILQSSSLLGASPVSGRMVPALARAVVLITTAWLARSLLSIDASWVWLAAAVASAAVFALLPAGRSLLDLE